MVLPSFICPFDLSAQYNPCDLTWRNLIRDGTANSPGVLLNQAVAFDSQRQVTVFFGGENALTSVFDTSDTWEWNGANWTKRNSGQAPSRASAAMAYDSDRGVCVMFGGGTNIFIGETPFNDTWEWNGSTWTLRQGNNPTSPYQPPPMESPRLAYDSIRKRTVLLGSSQHIGFDYRPITNTWEWDGNNWSVHTNAPPPRVQSAMAFDPIRGVTVLFGGSDYENNAYLNDTWTWDGTLWRRAAVTRAPTPRTEHAMAFDARRQVLILFGGFDGNIEAPLLDTHEWNGTSWRYATNANALGLTGRRLHQMWYETGQQRAMVFGGTASSRAPNGAFIHTIYDGIYEARPPGPWVAFTYPGQRP